VSDVLEVEHLDVELGGRPVLRDVRLTVDQGETLAVLGANGSGKSTLVRTMLGLLPARRGVVRLFGTDLADFSDHQRVGYVPQRTTAAAGVPASVWEVVSAGRLARRRAWQPMRAADRRAVRAALEAVDLADRARDAVSVLSGGQQQRVLIARALAGEPDLLVLDEPTAGVDLAHQQVFADLLATLTAHELGPLASLVTRSVVMRDGRVAYDGPPVEAFTDVHAHAHHPVEPPADHHPQLRTAFDERHRGRTP
jgi:zinc transport system ATP-binding protein